jgi:hypothetical protein
MDALTVIFSAIDLPLVVGIVVLLQAFKGLFKKGVPKWLLFSLLFVAGFVAAFLKVNISTVGVKGFVAQGVIYAAGANLVYKTWGTARDIAAAMAKRKG